MKYYVGGGGGVLTFAMESLHLYITENYCPCALHVVQCWLIFL